MLGLAESFFVFRVEQFVGIAQDAGDFVGKGAVREVWLEGFVVDGDGFFAGEPMLGLPKQVVAHFPEFNHVEAFGKGPEA